VADARKQQQRSGTDRRLRRDKPIKGRRGPISEKLRRGKGAIWINGTIKGRTDADVMTFVRRFRGRGGFRRWFGGRK